MSPADFPNVAKVAAPSRAACFVSPSELAALLANFSICPALSPNSTPTFESVSPRFAALWIAENANAVVAAAAAAIAAWPAAA